MREEIVASFNLDLRALKLEFKTTCDALRNWPGGPAEEQEFLGYKKQELFRALVEQTHQIACIHAGYLVGGLPLNDLPKPPCFVRAAPAAKSLWAE